MEDVLEIYERSYNPTEPVVCLDEKPVTLHDDVRPARPMAPGKPRRPDNEYKRCGTANVFCAVEPKAGKHFTLATPNRSARQLAQALEIIIDSYPAAHTIHLVLDNLTSMAPRLSWITSAMRRGPSYGTVSPFTKRPSTVVGSIRRRSKSACLPANASLGAESPHWRNYSRKPRHGMPESTTTESKSTGSSPAKRPARNSAISLLKQTDSSGHRPSGAQHNPRTRGI
jgi:hypothetical protein